LSVISALPDGRFGPQYFREFGYDLVFIVSGQTSFLFDIEAMRHYPKQGFQMT